MAKKSKEMEKADKTSADANAWRLSVIPEVAAQGAKTESPDEASLRLYAEMVEHAVRPTPESSC
jgi:hypothetical protein